MPHLRYRLCGLAVLVVFVSTSLRGADLTWDGDTVTTGLQDGAGTWNTTDINRWYNSTTTLYQAWSNGTPDLAIFGAASGAPGTVTLGTPITASGLRFDVAGYTISGSTLTLAGAPTVTANSDATLSSVLAGTVGMTKDGAGILRLGGSTSNTLTGTTSINAGSLYLSKTGTSTVAVAGNIQVNPGGTLRWETTNGQLAATTAITVAGGAIHFNNSSPTFASYTQTSGGQVTSSGNGGTVTITGTLAMSGGTVLTLNSGGQWSAQTLDLTGYTTSGNAMLLASDSTSVLTRFTVGSGGLIMSGQTLALNRATVAGRLGNELVLGGNVTASGTNSITYPVANVRADSAVNQVNMGAATRTWDITTGTTTVNLSITGGAGLTKAGAGILVLGGLDANIYAGTTTLSAGTLALAKTAGVNAVPGNIVVSDGTLRWDQSNQVPDDATLTVNGGQFLSLGGKSETFANYTQTAGQGFSGSSGNSGVVTVTGLARVSGGGAINVNSGGQMTLYQADFTGGGSSAIVVGGNSTARVTSMTIGAGGITISGQTITLAQGAATGTPSNAQGSELILLGSFNASGTSSIVPSVSTYGVTQVNLGSAARTFNITSGTTTSTVPFIGTGGVHKTGAGTLALNTASTYSGKTTVSQGTVSLGASGSISSSTWVQVDSGATFNTSAVSGGYALSGTTVLSGSGNITGSLQVGATSQLRPGTTSDAADVATAGDGAGTLAVSAALVFTPAAPATVAQLQIFGSGAADKITVGTNLVLNGNSNIAVAFGGAYTPLWGDSWELIDWAGTLTTGGFSTGTNLRSGLNGASEGNLDLPDLTAYGHLWQISNFSGSGSLIITIVPEPSRLLLLVLGATVFLRRHRRQVGAAWPAAQEGRFPVVSQPVTQLNRPIC